VTGRPQEAPCYNEAFVGSGEPYVLSRATSCGRPAPAKTGLLVFPGIWQAGHSMLPFTWRIRAFSERNAQITRRNREDWAARNRPSLAGGLLRAGRSQVGHRSVTGHPQGGPYYIRCIRAAWEAVVYSRATPCGWPDAAGLMPLAWCRWPDAAGLMPLMKREWCRCTQCSCGWPDAAGL